MLTHEEVFANWNQRHDPSSLVVTGEDSRTNADITFRQDSSIIYQRGGWLKASLQLASYVYRYDSALKACVHYR